MEAHIFLTNLSIILVIGIFCSYLAKKLNIPDVLILLIAGIIVGSIPYNNSLLVSFPAEFLSSISILALVMIVFDSSSRFKFKRFAKLSPKAVELSFVFLLFNLLFFTLILNFALEVESILLLLLFSSLMSGTSPAAVLSMIKCTSSRVSEFLRVEALINTPITVLFPFIILEFITTVENDVALSKFIDQILPFLQQFVAGIGAGILVGLISLRFMKKKYSRVLSPLAMITAALIAYILAENLDGSGVLSVTALGLLFGNVYLRQKIRLQDFSSIFSNSLEILVFILIGLVIKIPFSVKFIITSFALFLIYIVIRFMAIQFSLGLEKFTLREKLFMTLNVQKGIAVAAVAFSISTFNIKGFDLILNLTLAFMLYSLLLSTITIKFKSHFITDSEEVPGKKSCKKEKS